MGTLDGANGVGRELYHGASVRNKTRKRDDYGAVDQRPRPREDWLRTPVEHLRIVPEDLWMQVQARRADTEGRTLRFSDGRLTGRPPKHAPKNLLAGLATCALCGGGLAVETSPRNRGRVAEYVCHRHRHTGTCTNTLHMKVEEVNEAVLQAIERHALTPEAIEQVITFTERDDAHEQQIALERERKDVEKRINRLRSIIETGAGDVVTLVDRLRELEIKRRAIAENLRDLRPIPRLPANVIEDCLNEWRRLLRQSTTQGRAVLQRVLRGRITFTPREDQRGYDFSAPTRFDKLFAGTYVDRPAFVANDTRGTEHICPEDTFEGDWGRLLKRAYGKRCTSPTGVVPEWTRPVPGEVPAGSGTGKAA